MEQINNNNEKSSTKKLVTKNEKLKSNTKTKKSKSKKYPKQGDPDFSWYHHTPEGRQTLSELDDIFGY